MLNLTHNHFLIDLNTIQINADYKDVAVSTHQVNDADMLILKISNPVIKGLNENSHPLAVLDAFQNQLTIQFENDILHANHVAINQNPIEQTLTIELQDLILNQTPNPNVEFVKDLCVEHHIIDRFAHLIN